MRTGWTLGGPLVDLLWTLGGPLGGPLGDPWLNPWWPLGGLLVGRFGRLWVLLGEHMGTSRDTRVRKPRNTA